MISHYVAGALRTFRYQKAATLINVLCLALGLAAFIVAWSVVRYQETAENHFSKAERIYLVATQFDFRDERPSINTFGTAEHVAKYLKEEYPQIETVIRVRGMRDTAVASGGEKISVQGVAADSDFLTAFDLRLVAGSLKRALGNPRSVLISIPVAMSLFGTTEALGKNVILDGLTDATVTGVFDPLPKSSAFDFGVLATWDIHETYMAAIAPANVGQAPREEWRAVGAATYVLLPDSDVIRESFVAGLDSFAKKYVPADQESFAKLGFKAIRLDSLATTTLDQVLFANSGGWSITTILMVLGGLILGLASVNYANLAVGQANGKLKELGTRRVMGASAGQVLMQNLSVTALHASSATVLALLVVLLVAPVLDQALDVEIRKTAFTDAALWVLLPSLLIGVVVVAGGYPALKACRVTPGRALRAASAGRSPGYSRTVMVSLQFAAACLLLAVVIVMQNQTQSLRAGALGESAGSVLLVGNNLNDARIGFDVYKNSLAGIPGLEAISAIAVRPFTASGIWMLNRTPSQDSPRLAANQHGVTDKFFETMGMPLLAGRSLDSSHGDALAPSGAEQQLAAGRAIPRSLVVDRSFIVGMGLSKPEDALNQMLYVPPPPQNANTGWQPLKIVGVVEDKPLSIQNFGSVGSVYQLVPRAQVPLLRVSAPDVGRALGRMTEVWNKLAPDIPLDVRFLDATFDSGFRPFSRMFNFVNGLVVLAVGIAIAGLIAMSIHESHHRYHEIAVRKTLGAGTSTVAWKLLGRFTLPVLIGNAIALPLAYVVAKTYLSTFLYRIDLTAWPFVLSFVATLIVAWAAVGYQTFRAARLNPATVLRYE